MSTVPVTPAQPPAVPPNPPAGAPAPGTHMPPARRPGPRRGLLVAALVVAVVLLVGSVGATAAYVHANAPFGTARVEAPEGRTFVVPGPGRDGSSPMPHHQRRTLPGAPTGPSHRYGPNPSNPGPSPSPSAG